MLLNNPSPIKALKISLTTCLFLIALPTLVWAGEFAAFGPEAFIRETGTPVTVTNNFSVLNPNTEFILRVYNGGLEDSEAELVSSSIISINGTQVLGPEEFNQNVNFIETPVTLQLENTIEVEVRGSPGGLLTIHIVGIDNVPPDIQIDDPQDGSLTNINPYDIKLSFNDDISGIDPDSFIITINDIDKTDLFNISTTGLSGSASGNILLSEGTNVINASISDFAGNTGSATSSFTVDITPPQISNLSPADGSILTDARPTISADFSDNISGVDTQTVKIILDEVEVTSSATVTSTGFSYTPSVDLANGTHTVTVDVKDKATNPATQVKWSFIISIKLPTAEITAPQANETVSGAVHIIGTATAEDFAYYYLYYGKGTSPTEWHYFAYGGQVRENTTLGRWFITSSYDYITNGTYTLKLEVRDMVGNESTYTVTVVVDNEFTVKDPYASPNSISPNGDDNYDTTTIGAWTNEEQANWVISIKDPNNTQVKQFTGQGSTIEQVWNGKNEQGEVVSDGVYTYEITATYNGQTVGPVTGTITVDATPPTALITSPQANETVSGTVDIIGTATDENFYRYVLYYGKGTSPTEWHYFYSGWQARENTTLGSWNTLLYVPNGTHTLKLEVRDWAGNEAIYTVTVVVDNEFTIVYYQASPRSISPNGDGRYDTTTIRARIIYEEANWVISIKDPNNTQVKQFTGQGSTIEQVWNGKNEQGEVVSDGVYTYEITATYNGQTVGPVTGTIVVDTTPPTALITSPQANETVSGTVDIIGTATDENFYRYVLYYGKGTSPTEWSSIAYGGQAGENTTLGSWNTIYSDAYNTNGTYTLRLWVRDWAGNEAEYTVTVVVDNGFTIVNYYISPNISPNGDGRYDTAYISARTTEEQANWVISIKDPNNTQVKQFTGQASSIEQVWNGKNEQGEVVSDGVYTCEITATYNGQTVGPVTGTITVDTTPPTALITSPQANETVSGAIDIIGTATDENFQRYYYLYYGKGTSPSPTEWSIIVYGGQAIENATLGSWNTTYPNAYITNGTYTLKLKVRDKADNEAIYTVTVVVDNEFMVKDPYASPNSISPNGDDNYDTTTIGAWTNEEQANWVISIKDPNNTQVKQFTGQGSSIEQVWNGKNEQGEVVSDGVYTYEITATYNGQTVGPVTGTITVDATPPTALITSPQANETVSGTIDIIGTATDENFQIPYHLYYGKGTSPTEWSRIAYGWQARENTTLGSWNTLNIPNGTHTLRLTVQDKIGNKSEYQVQINLDNLKITDVSSSPKFINPALGQTSTIYYTLDRDADVIITIQDLSYNAIATLGPYPKPIGTNTDTWDGRDDTDNIVPDGAYTFTIEATSETRFREYTPEYIPGVVGVTGLTMSDIFDPHNNELCQINYSLADYAEVAEVLIRVGGIGSSDPNWAVVNWEPRSFGFNTDYWNGRDPNGNIVDLNTATIAIWTRALPDEPIIVVSELTVSISTDPYSIIPSYGEFTTITYTISETANVTVSVYDPDRTLVKTLEENAAKSAGTYELTWDGTDSNGKVVSQEGSFTVKVEATGGDGKTTTALGNISVY